MYMIQSVLLRVRIMISTHACRVLECRRALVCIGLNILIYISEREDLEYI